MEKRLLNAAKSPAVFAIPASTILIRAFPRPGKPDFDFIDLNYF
jgi:hypothetical protein